MVVIKRVPILSVRRRIAAAKSRVRALRSAKRGGTKTIFVGGQTFYASGGKFISKQRFEAIRGAEAKARAEAARRAAEAKARAEAARRAAEAKARAEAARRAAEAKARAEAARRAAEIARKILRQKKIGVVDPTLLEESFSRRKELEEEAKRRRRPFTRFEAQRFLGGGAGISALRIATKTLTAKEKQKITTKVKTKVVVKKIKPISKLTISKLTLAERTDRLILDIKTKGNNPKLRRQRGKLLKKKEKTKNKEHRLVEKEYNKAINRVIDIKSEINEPLNKYDLIFTHKAEFDPKAAKAMIMEDLKKRG